MEVVLISFESAVAVLKAFGALSVNTYCASPGDSAAFLG